MKRLLTSCFGLGRLPIAPGSWASAPVALIFGLMCYFTAGVWLTSITMVIIAAAASVVCVKFASAVIEATGRKDPSEVVVDEVTGQAVAFLGISAAGGKAILITALAGFLLFRVLDIIKPWPCKRLEKLPAGWGILADDLAAGLYAMILLQICLRFWITG